MPDERPRYSVEFTSRARRDLRGLKRSDRQAAGRVAAAIRGLAAEPRPEGCTKLRGGESAYRIRVGAYRVLYTIEDERVTVEVVRIGHRREVYELLFR